MGIDLRSPGLNWRTRGAVRVAYWIAAPAAVEKGYPIRTQRLWSGAGEPTEDERQVIRRECHRLQGEMKQWVRDPNHKRSQNRAGFVYFARSGDRVKIGFSRNVMLRLGTMRVGSAQPIELLGTLSATRQIENFIHGQFRRFHERGEWYRADPDLLAFIARNAEVNGTRTRAQTDPNVSPASAWNVSCFLPGSVNGPLSPSPCFERSAFVVPQSHSAPATICGARLLGPGEWECFRCGAMWVAHELGPDWRPVQCFGRMVSA